MKNDGQPIRDSVPWNSRCTKDPCWLNNVFLFSTEIWTKQLKNTLYDIHWRRYYVFLIVLIFGGVDISNPTCPYQSAPPPLRYSQVHPNDAQICRFAHLTPARENGRWGTLDSRPKWLLKILVIIILNPSSGVPALLVFCNLQNHKRHY